MEKLLTSIFPTKCYYCNKNTGPICQKCINEALIVNAPFCMICEKPSIGGETHLLCRHESKIRLPTALISAYKYHGVVQFCIKRSKYTSRLFYLLKFLTYKAVDMITRYGIDYSGYLVIPVPLSKQKQRLRGYNQAELIARALANKLNLEIDTKLLFRHKVTHSQYAQSRKERWENLKRAFYVKKSFSGKKVLLVDDICTTGATFIEISRVLYNAGASDVRCYSLAKSFLDSRRNRTDAI